MATLIYETRNFNVEAPCFPLIDREDGGYIAIDPQVKIKDRQALNPEHAIELIRLEVKVITTSPASVCPVGHL